MYDTVPGSHYIPTENNEQNDTKKETVETELEDPPPSFGVYIYRNILRLPFDFWEDK